MTCLRVFACSVSLLLIGFLCYDAAYVIAPRSLHGPYAVSYDWRDWQGWELKAQPEEIVVFSCFGPACLTAPPRRVTLGRFVQIGPVCVSHGT